MPRGDTEVELGRLCGPDTTTNGPRRRLLYLREQAMIVLPHAKTKDGWECVIVGSRAPRQAHHLTLTDLQVTYAYSSILARPEHDPEGYARLVWMSQAFRHWPGGATPRPGPAPG